MPLSMLLVCALVLPGIRDLVTEAGRAYVAGNRPPDAHMLPPAAMAKPSLPCLTPPSVKIPAADRDLIIVGDAPAETLFISGPWSHEGDIYVINDGVLKVQDAEFELRGSLYALDSAGVTLTNSCLTLRQRYLYQYGIITAGSATFVMEGGSVSANRFPYSFAVIDSAAVSIQSVHYHDFSTYSLFGAPVVGIRGVNLAGEFVVMDRSRCTLADVDTALIWCSMMNGAVVECSFPPDGPVYGWTFDGFQPGISGLEYTVTCDSVYHPWWGMLSGTGSHVTIRDSHVRTCGVLFEGAAVDTLSGLVGGMHYGDTIFNLTDRTLRFVNTEVATVSLYPWHSAHVYFSGCIVGEVLSMDQSLAFGTQYYLDGSGGHLEACGQAGNVAALAMLTADVLARDEGFVVLASCAQLWGQNWAEDESRLFLIQTMTESRPVPFDGGVAGYQMITGPAAAPIGTAVPIEGSVWVDCGPDAMVDLAGYTVFHEPAEGIRIPIESGTGEVRDGTLAVWHTEGLAPGQHVIVVEFHDTLGDTLEGFHLIRLEEAVGADDTTIRLPRLDIGRAGCGVQMTVTAVRDEVIRLSVHDIAGRLVRLPMCAPLTSDRAVVSFGGVPSGVYVARLACRQGVVTRVFTIAR